MVGEIQIVAEGLMGVRENNRAHHAYEQGRFAAEVLMMQKKRATFTTPHHCSREQPEEGEPEEVK